MVGGVVSLFLLFLPYPSLVRREGVGQVFFRRKWMSERSELHFQGKKPDPPHRSPQNQQATIKNMPPKQAGYDQEGKPQKRRQSTIAASHPKASRGRL